MIRIVRSTPVLLLAFLLSVGLLPASLHAQSTPADSLQNLLDSASGVERARLMSELSTEIAATSFDEAVNLASGAVDAWLAAGDSVAAVQGYIKLGHLSYGRGDYEPALIAFQAGLDLGESIGDLPGQAYVLNEIGTLVKKQGDLDRAMEFYEDALARSRAAQDTLQIGNSLNNMGIVHDSRGEFDRAMELFEESTRMKAAVGDRVGLTYNYDNMGMTQARLGNFDASEQFFLQSANLRRELGDERGYGVIMGNLGELMLMKGDRNAALDYVSTAIRIAEATKYHDFRRHLYGVRSSMYRDAGDFRRALAEFERMTTLKDSLFNVERSRQLLELQTAYETEKKEQTIALQQAELAEKQAALQRNYVLIALLLVFIGLLMAVVYVRRAREQLRVRHAQMEASIASQENERKRIARDLHDGLGQLISTVRLHVAESREAAPDALRKSESALNDMHAEIRNIAFNLMPETLLQKGAPAACEELGARLTTDGFFTVSVSAFEVRRFSEDVEIAVFRIVQEWLNNVAKHAGARDVAIQFVQHESELVVMVEDDGRGFDTTKLGAGPGHGWNNIRARAEHLNGMVHVDSRPDREGSTLVVTIPVPHSVARAA